MKVARAVFLRLSQRKENNVRSTISLGNVMSLNGAKAVQKAQRMLVVSCVVLT